MGVTSAVAVDWRWYSQVTALLNILRTLFICAAIYLGTVLFNHDASRLVLQPIERMLKQVSSPLRSCRAALRAFSGAACS